MKKILVGVDGSEHSLRAVKLAAGFARESQSQLVLTTVIPPSYAQTLLAGTYGTAVEQSVFDAIAEAEDEAAQKVLAAAKDAAGQSGVVTQAFAVRGRQPSECLLQLSTEPDVWLVVVGARGHGAVHRLLLGSNADRVVHGATKPVVVVP